MGFDLILTEIFDLLVCEILPNGVRHISLNSYDSNLSIILNHFVHESYSLEVEPLMVYLFMVFSLLFSL